MTFTQLIATSWRTIAVRVAAVVLLVIGLLLRTGHLETFRPIGHDELSWIYVGDSLLRTGVPTSWSYFPHPYASVDIGCDVVVTPMLEYPPLFALFIGTWSLFTGALDWCAMSWEFVRIPMIAIAFLVMFFTYLLARRLFGEVVALFSLLAFTFFPSHVITSRFVIPEHFIGLLLILGLYCYTFFVSTQQVGVRYLMLVFMTLLSIAAPLSKFWGFAVPGSLVLLSAFYRRWHVAALLSVASLVSGVLLMLYGYYYDWDVFRDAMYMQHGRAASLVHFWTLFTKLDIGWFEFYDPSIIFGMIGALLLVATSWSGKEERGMYVFAPLFNVSFVLSYLAPYEAWGWYKYFVYPLLALGMGFIFAQLYRGQFAYYILFLPLLLVMLQHSGIMPSQLDRQDMVIVLYALTAFSLLLPHRTLASRALFLSLLALLVTFEVVWAGRILGYL